MNAVHVVNLPHVTSMLYLIKDDGLNHEALVVGITASQCLQYSHGRTNILVEHCCRLIFTWWYCPIDKYNYSRWQQPMFRRLYYVILYSDVTQLFFKTLFFNKTKMTTTGPEF